MNNSTKNLNTLLKSLTMKLQLQLLLSIFLYRNFFSISNLINSQTSQEEKKVELLSHRVESGN